MVAPAMAELQLEGLSAEGMPKDLMPETNGEDGFLPDQLGNFLMDVVERRGVSWAVGKKDAIRVLGEDFTRGCLGMNDLHAEAILTETAEDVAFDAEVVSDDVIFHGRQRLEHIAGVAFGLVILN